MVDRRRRRRGRGSRQPSRDLAGARAVARRRFGIAELHPQQERAITAVLEGRDTLAVLPTGYGKSLIYQLPAVLTPRPTIVVSPLIALMTDQEKSLQRRGVPVVRLDSTLRVAERREALERIAAGGSLVVLTTPETLESDAARDAFHAAEPWMLCVDEAHCISEWGHDFRPAYLRLGRGRGVLGDVQLLALTATATPRVRDHVAARLGMEDPAVVTAPPDRPNLRLEVELVSVGTKPTRLGALLRKLARPAIVYCSTTVDVDRLWTALQRTTIPVDHYHGRMPKAEREAAQKRFMRAKPRVMIATSAFGMGIDKPDIRTILHYQAPGSIEQYVQEAGRAGRDGKPSRCILLYDPEDLEIQKYLQKQGRVSTTRMRMVARALEAWAGEHQAVDVADLALSADVPQTAARSTAAQLEELGVLERDSLKRLHLRVPVAELRERIDELLRRLETRRREDEERLEALDEYANTLGCRSAFIRRWFGEENPPDCGRCDRCRAAPPGRRRGQRRRKRRKATGRHEGAPRAERRSGEPPAPGRKRRRRRRPKKKRSGGERGGGEGGGGPRR